MATKKTKREKTGKVRKKRVKVPVVIKNGLESYNEVVESLVIAKPRAKEFYEEGVKKAGRDIRKLIMESIKTLRALRKDISSVAKARKKDKPKKEKPSKKSKKEAAPATPPTQAPAQPAAAPAPAPESTKE